ncbi:unnamed protein product [Cuscuta campestris]|uniref:Retrotransposon gag domain-containing protein n=1 Tax=Cuscuta campestris TaxID=132261 RepID=A0A484KM94_9ASTE|nr:unnamed protein product [Cuscuta campestris]
MGYLDGTIVAKSVDDAEWYQFDALLQGWILSTISDEVSDLDLANSPTASAFWKAIYKLFHDNKHARAMQLEHRFRTTVKRTKKINEYCHTLKNLADYLDDVDALVTEHALVLQVRSALLLVEQQQADALPNAGSSTALLSFSGGGGSHTAGGGQSRQGSNGQNSGRGNFSGSNRGNSGGYRGRDRGRGRSSPNQRQPGGPNTYQFSTPSPGLLGPRPYSPYPAQAHVAHYPNPTHYPAPAQAQYPPTQVYLYFS